MKDAYQQGFKYGSLMWLQMLSHQSCKNWIGLSGSTDWIANGPVSGPSSSQNRAAFKPV